MNSKPPNRPDPQPLSDADERVIDALISELQGFTPSPPDLTEAILRDLASQSWSDAKVNPHKESPVTKKRQRPWILIAGSAMALAASALLLLSRWQAAPEQIDQTAQIKKVPAIVTPEARDRKIVTAPKAKLPVSREGVPLVRNEPMVATTGNEAKQVPPLPELVSSTQADVNEAKVLSSFNDSLANYWNRVGVTPAAPISDGELVARIEARFGSRIDLSAGKPIAQSALATKEDCAPLASRMVEQLFRDLPLVADARKKMIEQATETISNGQRFDELVGRWIADESLFDRSQPERLSEGLATNLLDADAACARCHDSPVDGRFAQHDYWSLASVFAPEDRSQLFYELPDGRQQVAEPRLPARWVDELSNDEQPSSESTIDPRQQLASSFIGSRTLAGALANRLWEIGFGAPLVSRASEPIAPPHDDALQTTHGTITNAILASNFDLRVAARLVMASDAMRRGQSELYASGQWRVANEQAIAQEALAQRTFAAAPPIRPRIERDKLLAMMESRIGGTPRALETAGTLLAQPSINENGKPSSVVMPNKPPAEEYMWALWIADRELLRDSWLHWIKDANQQQHHAVYGANKQSIDEVANIVQRLISPADEKQVAADNANDRLLWVLRQTK